MRRETKDTVDRGGWDKTSKCSSYPGTWAPSFGAQNSRRSSSDAPPPNSTVVMATRLNCPTFLGVYRCRRRPRRSTTPLVVYLRQCWLHHLHWYKIQVGQKRKTTFLWLFRWMVTVSIITVWTISKKRARVSEWVEFNAPLDTIQVISEAETCKTQEHQHSEMAGPINKAGSCKATRTEKQCTKTTIRCGCKSRIKTMVKN